MGAAGEVLQCGGGFGSQRQSRWGGKGRLPLFLPLRGQATPCLAIPFTSKEPPRGPTDGHGGATRAAQSCLSRVSTVLPYGLGLYLSTNQLYLSNKYVLGKAQKCIFLEIISICTSQRIYWFSYTPEIRVETLYSREADTCAAYQSYTYGTKDTSVESNWLYLHQHTTCSIVL